MNAMDAARAGQRQPSRSHQPRSSHEARVTYAPRSPRRASLVCVVGAGYVGLTTAACLADLGHDVCCVESNPARLDALHRGEIPIVEPGLEEIVAATTAAGTLRFTSDIAAAMDGCAIAMLCVGTPPRATGDPDLRQLAAAAAQVSAAATRDAVIVVKSTVPPGTCEAIGLLAVDHARAGVTITIASNPEFLREGHAVTDFMHPDRVVVGSAGARAAELVADLYPEDVAMVTCDTRAAELVKYASNTFLAIKISFANEVAGMCERLGADALEVLEGVGLDSRIGSEFLHPGAGYGGSCLPKDVAGFAALGHTLGWPVPLAEAAQQVNTRARHSVTDKLRLLLGDLAGRTVTVLGLAFKAGTDDVRDSPAVALVHQLSRAGASVHVFDPLVFLPGLPATQVPDPYEAALGADALVVATAWPAFAALDYDRLAKAMNGRVVVDAVNTMDLALLAEAGLEPYGTGRGRPVTFHPVVWQPLQWTASG